MILHVDGDAFFASCEIALDPALRGKPVVTGSERGIVLAMSYEAKARGISRGLRMFEVRKICPEAIIVPSHYDVYAIFSARMFAIVRRHSDQVEEYSVDECFADMTGLPESLHLSYAEIAGRIKHDLESELGMTFSIGVAPSKVLAKIASKWKKPSGLTVIFPDQIEQFLADRQIGKVWGIGGSTSIFLGGLGIRTALDFISKSQAWVDEHLDKSCREIWHELRGVSINPVNGGPREQRKSIMKTRTFKPPSTDKEFIFSQLSKNIENACAKARSCGLLAREISFFLKTQEFLYHGVELKLPVSTNMPQEILKAVRQRFDEAYYPNLPYRASGITLRSLISTEIVQADLFGQQVKTSSFSKVYSQIDRLSHKYGKHSIFMASSLRAVLASEKSAKAQGETNGRKLGIPLMGEVS